MNKRLLIAGLMASTVLIAGCNGDTSEEVVVKKDVTLETLEQKVIYTVASGMATNFKQRDIPIDTEVFMLALADIRDGVEPRLTQEQMQETMQSFQEQQMVLQQVKQKELADTQRAEGEAFLVENATKEGVMTTESGLQYKVLEAGEGGVKPVAADTVKVHYAGRLLDGTEFDSSYKRNQPTSFGLNQVISGWTEGLQLMETGSKYEFYIPSDLAYGPGGNSGIPPNSTLIFVVELLEVTPVEAPAAAE